MRQLLATAAIVGLLAAPGAASAQPAMHGEVKTQRVYQDSVNENVKEVLLLPVRAVTGAVAAPIGAIGGTAKRTGDSVEWVNNHTFRKVVDKHERTTEKPGKVLGRGAVMVPVGVAGTAAALPLGVSFGAVEGAYKGFVEGFHWPDKH